MVSLIHLIGKAMKCPLPVFSDDCVHVTEELFGVSCVDPHWTRVARAASGAVIWKLLIEQ